MLPPCPGCHRSFSTDRLSYRHKAIIAYLTSTNLHKTATTLREELDIGDSLDEATTKKYAGLLEKKWTSVVRLQKKVRAAFFFPAPTLFYSISPFSLVNNALADHGIGIPSRVATIRA